MHLPYFDKEILGSVGPAINSSLSLDESAVLYDVCRGKNVLEIGALLGYSTCVIASVSKSVVSIDPHTGWGGTEARFRDNLSAHGLQDKVEVRVGFSQDVVPSYPAGSFDVAWIDADHSYGAVLRDAYLALNVTKEGGVLVFHDWDEDDCPEVRPALERFSSEIGIDPQITDTVAVFQL